MFGVSVLLGAPHEGMFLRGDLKDIWIEGVNDWVANLSLFINLLLRVLCKLVSSRVRGQEICRYLFLLG